MNFSLADLPVKIAKIVASNSHVDYVGRVIDPLDATDAPQTSDYGFAQFVRVDAEDESIVGVIFNTQLATPDYAQFGPRLSPAPDLKILSPDFLNEQGVLVQLLLLGWHDADARAHHTVPRRIIPAGADVYAMSEAETQKFHTNTDGNLQLHYFSQVIAHAGAFAVPLIEAIVAQLENLCSPIEKQRLCVLKKSLVWQRTMGGVRL